MTVRFQDDDYVVEATLTMIIHGVSSKGSGRSKEENTIDYADGIIASIQTLIDEALPNIKTQLVVTRCQPKKESE